MLKSVATASSECAAKQKNKAGYNTDYIVPDLTDFFDWKTRNVSNCIKYCAD